MAILRRVSKRTGKASWQVLIDRPDPVTGARKRVTIGTFTTKREAERAEAKAITERDRGTLVDPNTATVGDLLERYLAQEMPKTVRVENRQEYRIVVEKHLQPAIGHVRVQRLTAEHIDTLYADLDRRGYSPSLIRKCHQRLSAALRMAVRWQLVSRNVADDVTPPKMTTKPPKVWTPGEAARFLATARAEADPLAPYWTLMLDTGARTSEVLGVTWSDVDLDAGTVRLGAQVVRLIGGTPTVKTGGKTESAARRVRVTAGTVALLREHRQAWLERKLAAPDWADEIGLVFVSRTGRPLNPRNVRRSFDRLVKLAGVPAISPHSLRKSLITSALAGGAPLRAVMERVGHRDPNTTLKTYAAVTRGMDDDTLGVIEKLLGAAPDDEPDTGTA